MNNFKFNDQLQWPYKDILSGNSNKIYKIDQNTPFHFRLTDMAKVIKNFQSLIKSDNICRELYNENIKPLDSLKANNLWIKVDGAIISMSLYDVYASLMRHLKDSQFEDQLFNCNEVSFVGPLGPFKSMSLVQCLNPDTIELMIFDQLIKNKLPIRKRRILTNSKIYFEYGDSFDQSSIISLKQITDNGLLFAVHDSIILDYITHGEYVKIFLDTRNLVHFCDNNLKSQVDLNEEFFFTKDELRYAFVREKDLVKSLSYNSGDTNEVYFFCRFSDMKETDIPNIFRDFHEQMNHYFSNIF